MSNQETYISHVLNTSATKETHVFAKGTRFPKFNKLTTDKYYELPSTRCNRSTTFGIGNKTDLVARDKSPPPGSYQHQSSFEKKDYTSTTSIGIGRDKVTFGSFLMESIKRSKNLPSPDRYHVKVGYSKLGGYMGERIATDPDLRYKRQLPGPGTYKLTATEMQNTGSYILSTFKNQLSPRYISNSNINQPKSRSRISTSFTYDIEAKEIGKYMNSKFKNIVTRTFSKAQRPGPDDKSKKFVPGFKYRRFSEFGGNLK